MSSSEETQRFRMGLRVDASDGRCGKLTRVIIDPVAQSLTHLVITPPHSKDLARLVSVDFVEAVESDTIRLRCTKQEFDQLDVAVDVQFLPADTDPMPFHATDTAHSAGSGRPEPIYSDRIPVGEVEISRGDAVHAKDGWIGAVQGLVIDPSDNRVTHLFLQEGHLWGRKQVAIPIGSAARIGDEVRVDLTKEEIGKLQAVRLGSGH